MNVMLYDLAAAALALAAALAVLRWYRPALTANRPRLYFVAAGAHILFIILLVLLNARAVDCLKKGGDSVCALQTARNTLHGDWTQTLGQVDTADGYGVPFAGINIFSRGYSIISFLYAAEYLLVRDARSWLLLQGALEIIIVFGAGWLLARLVVARARDELAGLLCLLAYDFCFVNAYIAAKEINYYTYSLFGIVLLFVAAVRGRQRHALAAALFVALLHNVHIPILLVLAAYLGWQRFIRFRTALLIAAVAVAVPLIAYCVIYPLTGQHLLTVGGERMLSPAALLYALPALPAALALLAACSGGSLLRDWRALLACLILLAVPFVMGRMLIWYEFYGGYIRFLWPFPFIALAVAIVRRPVSARPLALAALVANLILAYCLGPLPGTRLYAHSQSPGNLEHYSPRVNHQALLDAVALVPPEVPVESSYTALQRLADRPFAYPLKYYRELTTNPVKTAHPPEYIVIDFLIDDFLRTNRAADRQAVYDYLTELVVNGNFAPVFAANYVVVLRRAPAPAAADASVRFGVWLTRCAQLDGNAFYTLTVAARHNQQDRVDALMGGDAR